MGAVPSPVIRRARSNRKPRWSFAVPDWTASPPRQQGAAARCARINEHISILLTNGGRRGRRRSLGLRRDRRRRRRLAIMSEARSARSRSDLVSAWRRCAICSTSPHTRLRSPLDSFARRPPRRPAAHEFEPTTFEVCPASSEASMPPPLSKSDEMSMCIHADQLRTA